MMQALDAVQESFILVKEKGEISEQPKFVRDSLNELIKTRKWSLERFISALKNQIGQQEDLIGDKSMQDYLHLRVSLMKKYVEIRSYETAHK